MQRLKNKTLLVTGGLTGAGKMCGIVAAREGANVAVAGKKSYEAFKALEEIQRENPGAIFVECDVTDEDQLENAMKRVTGFFSSIDIALNYLQPGPLLGHVDFPEHHDPAFNCMRKELSLMARQKKGVIVNISSLLDEVDLSGSPHFVTVKRGVQGISRNDAFEYAGDGIRVNAILYSHTPPTSRIQTSLAVLSGIQHAGNQEGLANLFIFLASDASSQVYGTTLEIASAQE